MACLCCYNKFNAVKKSSLIFSENIFLVRNKIEGYRDLHMNEYTMSELSIGMIECFSKKVTLEMMKAFLQLSGDENPLHIDEVYAKSKGFQDRVVYGMLTSSFISTLGGCYLPGKYCIIQGVETKFLRPVYIGDEITVTGEVVDIREELNYIEIRVTMKNQKGEKVLRGTLKAGVLDGE